MKESLQLFQLTFENAGMGMALVDLNGVPFKTNAAFQKIVGFSGEEIAKMPFKDFTHPEDVDIDLRQFDNLLKGNIASYSLEKRYITKQEQVVWCTLNVSLLRDDKTNEPIYAIGIIQDISQRKKAELKLEQSNQQLEHFAYLCSHDLKQPLSNIKGFLDLLIDTQSEVLDEDGITFLNLMDKAYIQLKNKLNVLLTYSRIGRNMEFHSMNIETLFNAVCKKLKVIIEEKQATITSSNLPTIDILPKEFTELLYELTYNALIFTKDGRKPEIHLECENKSDVWLFKLSDNGMGIEQHYFERIFQIFQQQGEHVAHKGLGAGLAYAKKIVEVHDGQLWLESEYGKGTTFIFSIPKNLNPE